jgi:hypothetical protein
MLIMAKKPSKEYQPSHTAQSDEAMPHCPYCGTTNGEKSALALMEQLYRSHTELRATLRSACRQMLPFEKQSNTSLERVRKVLKRADNIQKMLRSPKDLVETLNSATLDREAPIPASGHALDDVLEEASTPKTRPRRNRLMRPHALRVLRFPRS